MNSDFANVLEIVVYLVVGTVAIALLTGWVIKRFGTRK